VTAVQSTEQFGLELGNTAWIEHAGRVQARIEQVPVQADALVGCVVGRPPEQSRGLDQVVAVGLDAAGAAPHRNRPVGTHQRPSEWMTRWARCAPPAATAPGRCSSAWM